MSKIENTIGRHVNNLKEVLSEHFPGQKASFTSKGIIAIAETRQAVENKTLEITSRKKDGHKEYKIVSIEKE